MAQPSPRIWRIALDEGPALADLLPLLDADERRRATAFMHEADRMAFIRSHAALRLLLGKALRRSPGSIAIGVTERNGKPRLDPLTPGTPSVIFSLSHSGSRALVGLGPGSLRLGVDLEARGAPSDWRALAERHFTADERRWLFALPPAQQGQRFLQCWTRKEAYLKAIGQGFSRGADSFRCRLDTEGRVVGEAFDAGGRRLPNWQALALDAPAVAGCAVIDGDVATLRVEDFVWSKATRER